MDLYPFLGTLSKMMHASPDALYNLPQAIVRAVHSLFIVIFSPLVRLLDAQRMVFAILRDIRFGGLTMQVPVHDPSKKIKTTIHQFGDVHSPLHATMEVHNKKFFERLIADEDIGFAESYMAGEWDTPDLTKIFKLLVHNKMDNRHIGFAILGRFLNWIWHYLQPNSISNSKKKHVDLSDFMKQENIHKHYDLSNNMFQLFLDKTMTYSCALYTKPNETLEEAQMNKIRAVIDKAKLKKGDHLLEIGSGWGALAVEAVRRTGCKVTTVTLSEEQYRFVQEKIRKEGLEDSITIVLKDYRLEAVGHKYFGEFFQTCDRLLKPNGVVVIQVITIPDQRYESYRTGCDFIQKYIFPGGLLPSLQVLTDRMTSHSSLMAVAMLVEDVSNIGVHYAKTLRQWFLNFRANKAAVLALGFDERFIRMWEYYLCYCEAGFQTRTLNTLHLVLTRPGNTERLGTLQYE